MESYYDRLLNELCKNGNLENFRSPLASLLRLIADNGVKVSARYDVGYSNYEDYSSSTPHIRISLINVETPLDIVWELMHEYGHHLSGKRKAGDNSLDREHLAWIHADRIIHMFPEFADRLQEYEYCKTRCLKSYLSL